MWKCFYAEYFHLIPKSAMPSLCFGFCQLTPTNGLDPLWIWINVASLISFYLSNSWQRRFQLKALIGSKKQGKMKYQNKSNKHRYIQSIFSTLYLILSPAGLCTTQLNVFLMLYFSQLGNANVQYSERVKVLKTEGTEGKRGNFLSYKCCVCE